jgi:hypothetical protein
MRGKSAAALLPLTEDDPGLITAKTYPAPMLHRMTTYTRAPPGTQAAVTPPAVRMGGTREAMTSAK